MQDRKNWLKTAIRTRVGRRRGRDVSYGYELPSVSVTVSENRLKNTKQRQSANFREIWVFSVKQYSKIDDFGSIFS